jgi:hypothetical protein
MAKTRVAFGEWTPDQPGILGGVTEAVNCYPVANGYAPIRSIQSYPNAETQASEVLLTTFGGKFGGQNVLFTASASKIFKFDPTNNNFVNVSKAGGYSSTSWDITQFGPIVIAANGNAKLQSYSLSSSSIFADLSADAPTAKFVTVVRDFVVAANVAGAESTLYWSDINNETNWVPSSSSQSDSQLLPDGGDITGLSGGEYGLVFLERAIYRMTYAGSPFFFQFDAISRSLGCISNGSIAQLSDQTYFLADDGFYVCNGKTVTPIGAEKVNRWFFENVAIDRVATDMSASIDPIRSLVIWVMPTASGKQLLIYNAKLNRWSFSDIDVNSIAYVLTASATLEQLDKISITQGSNTLSGTYTQSGTTITVTATNHGMQTGGFVYFDATTGGAADNFYQVTRTGANTFTVTSAASATITTSNCTLSLPSIDSLSASFDDRAYAGGNYFLAGVSGQKIYGFTGDFAPAYVSSQDLDLGRSLITLAKPIVDNGIGNIAVASRTLMNDDITYTAYSSPDTINRVSLRSNGNYHRIRVQPTGDDWRTIVGVDVEYAVTGER